ncbi:MAG TPA: hypothetical protein P5165_08900, partial [Spirochaetia bacterium]|nr:hypothetical protein [Spirochaetia bacterium]
LILPEIALGLSANYLSGGVAAPIGSSQTVGTVTFSQPMLDLAWTTKTLDLTAQVSKKLLLILTPYAGVGYTLGSSEVKGGVSSETNLTAGEIADLEAAGFEVGDTGFLYATTSKEPTFRIYGGLSLNILVALDLQMMYVPATKNLGGSLTARIQL